MDRYEWKLFLTNVLNKMPELLAALTSDAMRDKLKGIAYNVDEILDVTRKNVQDSAALLVQCAAEVLQTFDEELDLEGDAPQTRAMSLEREVLMSEIRQALTPSLTRE